MDDWRGFSNSGAGPDPTPAELTKARERRPEADDTEQDDE
jgi:hypothetical protein